MTKALDYITTLEGTPNKVKIDNQELTLLEVRLSVDGPWLQVRVAGVWWFEDGEYDFEGQRARLHSAGVVSKPGLNARSGYSMQAYTDLFVRFVEDKVGITLADGSKV